MTPINPSRIPLWLKLAYTAFLAVLIPVYWTKYGPTNFLYFCDLALFLTVVGMWTESPLLVSMPAVGILLPQVLWCLDFVFEATGHKLVGMTAYMFNSERPLFLRSLSFFHGWLPFLLAYLVYRLGYDRRALPAWTFTGWTACLVSYFLLPGPSEANARSATPCNVNYVWGMSETAAQTWLPAPVYLAVWMLGLLVAVYVPTHYLLRWAADRGLREQKQTVRSQRQPHLPVGLRSQPNPNISTRPHALH